MPSDVTILTLLIYYSGHRKGIFPELGDVTGTICFSVSGVQYKRRCQ